jgi:transcriptional regulator with XRE-family HTH domain
MKPSQREREILAGRIRQAREKSTLSNSEIASLARVDPGQTSRILDGKFRTVSGNVVQICNVLGIDPHGAGGDDPPSSAQASTSAAWAKLEASVRRAWDETPQGAERLARVIDAVAEVSGR